MGFLVVVVIGAAAVLAAWRMAVSAWGVETPRQAAEAAWYRLNPPRTISVGALQQRIMRAAVGARVVSVRGTALVPSTFEVALHPDDLEVIAGVRDWIASEIGAALEDRAETEGWELQGRPVVAFATDPTRVPGRPEVRPRHEQRTVHVFDRPGVAEGSGSGSDLSVGWLRPVGDHDPIALTGSDPIILGRGAAATIDLADPSVSRRHCELRRMEGGWLVADLGSANGTSLNGVLLTSPARVRGGDKLDLAGRVTFVAEAVDPTTRVAPETGPMPATRVAPSSG